MPRLACVEDRGTGQSNNILSVRLVDLARSLPVGWGHRPSLFYLCSSAYQLPRCNQIQVLSNPPQDWYVSRNLDKGTQVLLVLAIYQYHSTVWIRAQELKDQWATKGVGTPTSLATSEIKVTRTLPFYAQKCLELVHRTDQTTKRARSHNQFNKATNTIKSTTSRTET